jgi:hypothetical protein
VEKGRRALLMLLRTEDFRREDAVTAGLTRSVYIFLMQD